MAIPMYQGAQVGMALSNQMDAAQSTRAGTRGKNLDNRAKRLEIEEYIANADRRKAERSLGTETAQAKSKALPGSTAAVMATDKVTTMEAGFKTADPASAEASYKATQYSEKMENFAKASESENKLAYNLLSRAMESPESLRKAREANTRMNLGIDLPKIWSKESVTDMEKNLQILSKVREYRTTALLNGQQIAANIDAVDEAAMNASTAAATQQAYALILLQAEMEAKYKIATATAEANREEPKWSDTAVGTAKDFVPTMGNGLVETFLGKKGLHFANPPGFNKGAQDVQEEVAFAVFGEMQSRWERDKDLYLRGKRANRPASPFQYHEQILNDWANPQGSSDNRLIIDDATGAVTFTTSARAKEQAKNLEQVQATQDAKVNQATQQVNLDDLRSAIPELQDMNDSEVTKIIAEYQAELDDQLKEEEEPTPAVAKPLPWNLNPVGAPPINLGAVSTSRNLR